MNSYVKLEITNQKLNCKNFLQAVYRASLKDDGVIDKKERKVMKRLEKATMKYVKALKRATKH